MELNNEYDVAAPSDTLWDVLNDIERIAPLVPGFELQEIDGDTYRGTIKVKVGAITASYNAEIEVVDRDAAARRVVMEVSGRERRGPGSVNAKVTSTLHPNGPSTHVSLLTDLQLTGRVAQVGGGVLADVSDALVRQFVESLEAELSRDGAAAPAAGGAASAADRPAEAEAGAPAASGEPQTGARTPSAGPQAGAARAGAPSARATDVLDLGAVAGPAMLRRMAPAAAAVAVPLVAILAYLLGRARR